MPLDKGWKKMVPFPEGVDPESRGWALRAMSQLRGNPDGHGLLTPPMREEIKKHDHRQGHKPDNHG